MTSTAADPAVSRVDSSNPAAPSKLSIVSFGFGISVAMWAIGYISHLPGVAAPGWLVLPLMLACIVAGGAVAGRFAAAGVGRGALVGLVAGLVNLLILGSFLLDPESNAVLPSAALWIPGSFLVHAALAAVGAAMVRSKSTSLDAADSRCVLAGVAVAATLLVVVAGGLVTSFEAGLAVDDWPNTFGTNMFLYPLAKMTGGIYYEHAHRLYGALVGLTTVVLAVAIWAGEPRRWVRNFALIAVAMVIAQGVMGGLRVTGSFTLAVDPDSEPLLPLAMAHGVFGQIFFAAMVVLFSATTPIWRSATEAKPHAKALTDYGLTKWLLAVVIIQIALGAVYRHTYTTENPIPHAGATHLAMAAIAMAVIYVAGGRAAFLYPEMPIIRRLGWTMIVLLSLQILLGIAALIAIMLRDAGPYPLEVITTTAHQANGVLVLGVSAALAVWLRRLATPLPAGREAAAKTEASAEAAPA